MRKFPFNSSTISYFSRNASTGWRIILLLLIGVTILVSSVSAACPSGYECLLPNDAESRWGTGNYERYSPALCDGNIEFPLFCYRQIPQVVSITCPSGYECLYPNQVVSRFGRDNYEQLSASPCDTGETMFCFRQKVVGITCPSGYDCMFESEAVKKWGAGLYELSSATSCGAGVEFDKMYCYHAKSIQSGCECLFDNDAMKRWGAGNYVQCSVTPCSGNSEFGFWYYFKAGASGNAPPVASFSFSQNQKIAPSTVQFDASASTDSDGIAYYKWVPGDQSSMVKTSTPYFSHIYQNPGSYQAILIVTDAGSSPMTTQTSLTVTVLPQNTKPLAQFTATTISGTASVSLDASGSHDFNDGHILSYDWDPGDGTGWHRQSSPVFTYTYSKPRTYTVTLKVTDDGNPVMDDTITHSVAVTYCPQSPDQKDTDGDGIPDKCDNCPTLSNSNQIDADKDVIGDDCDNCKMNYNPDQQDSDKNGVGDICQQDPCTMDVSSVPSFSWRDWRGINWMTPVQDQQMCGSCWAFSSVGATEAVYNINQNALMNLDLSEQELVSPCFGNGDAGDCEGGNSGKAIDYIKSQGLVTETAYPYLSVNEVFVLPNQKLQCLVQKSHCSTPVTCQDSTLGSTRWKIISYGSVSSNVKDVKKALLCRGPLVVNSENWWHSVVLVGWNDNTGEWTIKNNWGTLPGYDGYDHIAYSGDSRSDLINSVYWIQGVYRT